MSGFGNDIEIEVLPAVMLSVESTEPQASIRFLSTTGRIIKKYYTCNNYEKD